MPQTNSCAIYDKEIATRLSTVEDLRRDDRIKKFIKWIRKQHPHTIPRTKKSNLRKKGYL